MLTALLPMIEGIISSVPEAIRLWRELAPLVETGAQPTTEQLQALGSLVRPAHDAVQVAHNAIAALVETHSPAITV